MSRPARDYALRACPECQALATDGLELTVTGNARLALFNWQGHKVRGKGVFGDESKHPEAELRCESCKRTFWSINPLAIDEARTMVES